MGVSFSLLKDFLVYTFQASKVLKKWTADFMSLIFRLPDAL